MNREIKFRAFDIENKEMLEVDLLDFSVMVGYKDTLAVRVDKYSDYFDREEMILMEYTGLKDITNTKIYEGDILEIGEQRRKVVVIFKDGCFGYKSDNCCISFKNQSPIVIGNIYENQNLLKECEE